MNEEDTLTMNQVQNPYGKIVKDSYLYKFCDSNETSLLYADNPDHRLVLGPTVCNGEGSGGDAEVALRAYKESEPEVRAAMEQAHIVVVYLTLGGGTGFAVVLEVCRLARNLGKFLMPVIVMPSMNYQEMTDEQYELATKKTQQLIQEDFRFTEILNDLAYAIQPPVEIEEARRMLDFAIAKGIRSLNYAFLEGMQFDVADTRRWFAGGGRMRFGHAELPPGFDDCDPDELKRRVDEKVEECFVNHYYRFEKKIAKGVVLIQGPWKQPTFGLIRQAIAARMSKEKNAAPGYRQKNVDAQYLPQPWGITVLFMEETPGIPKPLTFKWPAGTKLPLKEMAEAAATSKAAKIPKEPRDTSPDSAVADAEDNPTVEHSRRGNMTGLRVLKPEKRATEWPISLPQFISLLNGDNEDCLGVAKNGRLQGLVTLTLDEVVDWIPLFQLKGLIEGGKISEENQKWLYDFMLDNAAKLRADSSFEVKLDGLTRRIQLHSVTDKQLSWVKDEGATEQQKRMIRFVKYVGNVWGPEKALALLSPENASRPRTISPPAVQSETEKATVK